MKPPKLPPHKLLQEIFYHTANREHFTDSFSALNENTQKRFFKSMSSDELVESVKQYFREDPEKLVYPTKSFAVALIYAALLYKYFGVQLLESLSDPDLLYGDDPCYASYDKTPDVYNALIYSADSPIYDMMHSCIIPDLPHLRQTVEYFYNEFLINEPIYKQLMQ